MRQEPDDSKTRDLNQNSEVSAIMSKLSILSELWDYLKVRKKWWLVPIVFFLLVIGLMLVMVEGSAVAPFIYTLF
jgi:hypothetical protein